MINNIKIGQEIWFKATWTDVNSGIIKKLLITENVNM